MEFQLQQLINSFEQKTSAELIKAIRSKSRRFLFKEDEATDRLMIVLDYENINEDLTEFERENRNVVLSRSDLSIVCYTFEEMYQNRVDLVSKFKSDNVPYTIQECIEGTLLSVYHHKDKWYFSTRRCLDANKSTWSSNKNHYDMLLESLGCSEEQLLKSLNPKYYYVFILNHYQNRFLVDYDKKYQEPEYKKVFLSCARDAKTHVEVSGSGKDDLFLDKLNVFEPNVFEDLNLLESEKYVEGTNLDEVLFQGLLVRGKLPDGKSINVRLLTDKYKVKMEMIPNSTNKYVSLLKLYQTGKIKEHLKMYPESGKIIYKGQTYDAIGLTDNVFKTLADEIFELFLVCYDIKNGKQKNFEIYSALGWTYKDVLYKLKGIYYTRRQNGLKDKKADNRIRESDVYRILKGLHMKTLVMLLKQRKGLYEGKSKSNDLNMIVQKIGGLIHNKKRLFLDMFTEMVFS